MLPSQIAALPKGWPPLGPTAALIKRLHEGKVLTAAEMAQLKSDAALAESMEQTDPDYLRACRRYRAQCAEEDRIVDIRNELEQKKKHQEMIMSRAQMQQEAVRDRTTRRLERNRDSRKLVIAAREARRSQLVERIALSERRTLVRATIQKALISQSRSDADAAERASYAPVDVVPGPGAYEPPPQAVKGGRFGSTPHADVRSVEVSQPGPGSYNPRYSGGPAITFGGLVESGKQQQGGASVPGPGSYDYVAPVKKGGTISRHVVKSQQDFALEQAKYQPGPGEYDLRSLDSGKSSTMAGRTRGAVDLQLGQSARRPGPGEYELPSNKSHRGGVMTRNPRPSPSLPAIAPGPGAYMQTPTIQQEREMRALSRQVVSLVKRRQRAGGMSAPTGSMAAGMSAIDEHAAFQQQGSQSGGSFLPDIVASKG